MNIGDEVYALVGGPGPELHVGIVREITGHNRATVYDACCGFDVKDLVVRPMTDEIAQSRIQFCYDKSFVPAGVYTMRQLLDIART